MMSKIWLERCSKLYNSYYKDIKGEETMKLAVYTKAGQVGLTEIDRPQIIEADDAIIRIVRTCVCGSDLWRYCSQDIEAGH